MPCPGEIFFEEGINPASNTTHTMVHKMSAILCVRFIGLVFGFAGTAYNESVILLLPL